MHLLVLGAFRHAVDLREDVADLVSMHLLVLGAFRHPMSQPNGSSPSPSQCTFWCLVLSDRKVLRWERRYRPVSMHLLVLGAFRLYPQKTAPQRRLPKRNRRRPRKHHTRPAHTALIKPHNRRKPPQTTPAPPTPPTHQYTTGFQQTQAKKPPPQGYLSETILTIFFNE